MCKFGDVKNVSKMCAQVLSKMCQVCDLKSVKFVDASSSFLQNFAMREVVSGAEFATLRKGGRAGV